MASCRRHSAPAGNKSGTLISTPFDADRAIWGDTVQCIHCEYTSLWVPGSEKWWSLCTRCGKLRCGRLVCLQAGCAHKNQVLDNMDAGMPWELALGWRPCVVTVPGSRIFRASA